MTKKIVITKKISIFLFALLFISINTVKLTISAEGLSKGAENGLAISAAKAYGSLTGNINKSLPELIGSIVGTILSFLGIVFLVLMIYGGFMWMLSGGDSTKSGKAKELIEAAIIGLIIILSAYAVTSWLGTTLTAPSSTQ